MTRWWTASCLFSLLVLSGGTALAQDEQSADNSTETTEPKANSDDASKAKTDGQTTVAAATGEQDQDDGKAGAPKDGTKAKADGQATAAATATVDAEDKKKQAEADATAVLGAAAPTPPPSPYQLFLTLGFQVGTGSFIPASNRDLVGYSLNFSGSVSAVEARRRTARRLRRCSGPTNRSPNHPRRISAASVPASSSFATFGLGCSVVL